MSLLEQVINIIYEVLGAAAAWSVYIAYTSAPGGSELKACDEIRFQSGSNSAYINLMDNYQDIDSLCRQFELENLSEPRSA